MKRVILGFLLASLVATGASAQESFRVELGRDGETIGELRPVFLPFEARPLPAISPAEVARRYQRLFARSDEPAVRIDALNRLANIRERSGDDIGFSIDEEQGIYRQAIDSYETILARGAFGGRLDELLYQMAKAYALTGQNAASVERLKQLVGLYPDSPLVPEARFRVAEDAFSRGRYPEAESGYRLLLDSEGVRPDLTSKARYMLGWSQFKQGEDAWPRAGRTFVAVLDNALPGAQSLATVPESEVDLIDDTFRILALMAARRSGVDTVAAWLDTTGEHAWTPLLYDRLGDYYAVTGAYRTSVAVNRAFVDRYPSHPARPAFMSQIVDIWSLAGEADKVRTARADYVTLFGDESGYQSLTAGQRAQWQAFSRTLADYYYHMAGQARKSGHPAQASSLYGMAAQYFERLAGRVDVPGPLLRLAGDAHLLAGQYASALSSYQASAYSVASFPESADAGWAAISLLRDAIDGRVDGGGLAPSLDALTVESRRFGKTFGADHRLPGLLADLASRWLAAGDLDTALDYAGQAIVHQASAPAERYTGWLLTARIRQQRQEYGLAERAWREAIALSGRPELAERVNNDSENLKDQLAISVYRQGEQAAAAGKTDLAVAHFQRVESLRPGSAIASKGRFDAANTLLRADRWQPAINELTRFRVDYPDHPLAAGIPEKLVMAYTASGQLLKAASELLERAGKRQDPWPDRLRAAALFHQADALENRDRLYKGYLATVSDASSADQHVQLQTMRQRLIESGPGADRWRRQQVEQELASQWHSEQTLQWAGHSAMILGVRSAEDFAGIALTLPLPASLDRKQAALEAARRHFINAESLGGEPLRSESLFRRAELYRVMAADLMASSIPPELNDLERMQYQMLLEEEAFPFEEKALKLHADNHQRIGAQGFDRWIEKSLAVLADLYPGRYQRSVRWMTWTQEAHDDA